MGIQLIWKIKRDYESLTIFGFTYIREESEGVARSPARGCHVFFCSEASGAPPGSDGKRALPLVIPERAGENKRELSYFAGLWSSSYKGEKKEWRNWVF